MAHFLKKDDKKYVQSLKVLDDITVQYVITDFCDFWIEKVAIKDFMLKMEEINPYVKWSDKTVLSIISEYPEKYVINLEESSVQLTYSSKRPLQIEFGNLKKCSPVDIQLLFTDGLMKLLIEQHLQLIELKSIILAKDQEIEDYKNQGGELLRRSKATQQFNANSFNDKWSSVKATKNINSLVDLKDLMKEKELPSLCELLMIGDVLQEIRDTTTLQIKSRSSIDFKVPSPSKPSKTRQRIMSKLVQKKPSGLINYLESDSDDEVESNGSEDAGDAEKEASNSNNPLQSTPSSEPNTKKQKLVNRELVGL